jgi:heat shock protein HslJ
MGISDLGFGNADYDKGFIAKMKLYTTVIAFLAVASLLACAGTPSGETETKTDATRIIPQRIRDIAGIEWHLKIMIIDNESIPLIKDTKITFSLDENGKVAGVASLNRYFGSFSFKEDGEIIWSKAFGMTRMAGPPKLMAQEAIFMQALPQTSRIYLKKEKLGLISTDHSTVLEFQEH